MIGSSADFSDLGGTQVHDFSDLGGVPVSNNAVQTSQIQQPQQTSIGQHIGNILSDMYEGGKRDLEDLSAGIMQSSANLTNFLTGKSNNYDVASQMFGISNPNILDKALKGIGQYAPYAIGGEAALPASLGRLGASALTGAAFGGTQSDPGQRLQGAILGSTWNPALELTGMGAAKGINSLSAIPDALKNYLSQFAASGVSKNVASDLNSPLGVTNETAFDMAKNNYNNYSSKENQAWSKVTDAAKAADASGAKFDDGSYTSALSDELNRLQDQSAKQSALDRKNKDSIDLLNGYIDDQHGTFSDAIEHNKALNADYQNEITPGKSLPFNTVNFAKNSIKSSMTDNLAQNNLSDSLGALWNQANQTTAQKNSIFNEIMNQGGNTQYSKFMKYYKADDPQFSNPSNFVNDYLPKSGNEGLQRMQQFSQMLGDDDTAKAVLKKNIFGQSYDPNDFLNKYNKLSPDQQNFLFDQQQNQSIQSLKTMIDMHPDALKNNSFQSLWNHSIPAILGAGIGHATGTGALEGALMGSLGAKGLSTGISKTFENPSIQQYFMQFLNQKQAPQSQDYLGQALSRGLPFLGMPQLQRNQ